MPGSWGYALSNHGKSFSPFGLFHGDNGPKRCQRPWEAGHETGVESLGTSIQVIPESAGNLSAVGRREEEIGHFQEGVMNSSARPTRGLRPSWRHDKRSAQMQKHFENGVVVCGKTQHLQAVFPTHFSFKWFCIWIQMCNHDRSYLRGKWILILAKQSFVKFIWRGFVGALEWRVVWENFPCSHGKFAFFWRSVRWRNLKRGLKIGHLYS